MTPREENHDRGLEPEFEENPRPDFQDFRAAVAHPASKAAKALRRRMRPRTRLLHAISRVRNRWMLIVQATVAAGIAFWFAASVLHHPAPFFAPMAAFISLSVMNAGPRIKNSLELVFGAALGVGIGDIIISVLGPGTWQLTVGVFVAMVIGVFIGRGPLVTNQAASSAVLIATIIPPGTEGTYNRMIDALVGGLIGVLILVVLPRSPVTGVRLKMAQVLDMGSDALEDVGQGMRTGDTDRIRTALSVVRSTQGEVTLMTSTIADAAEQVRISPLRWKSKAEIQSLSRVGFPIDNAVRNIRVLARRAITAREDHIDFSEDLTDLVLRTSAAAHLVGRFLADDASLEKIPAWGELPYEPDAGDKQADGDNSEGSTDPRADVMGPATLEETVRYLRRLAARMHPSVVENATLSEQVVFAQCRSIMVDLLQACGLSRLSAVATLPPTTSHPAMPPEVWDE